MKTKTTSIPPRYKRNGKSLCGGFGDVILCEDTHLSRKVAIKFLQNHSDTRRLWDELHALLLMRSKHVVQMYDIVVESGCPTGIVEEYIDGQDLFESDFASAALHNYIKTIWQIAAGISDIHEAGIIHRDIKPNNIKIDNEGIVKIFDFGLAREEGPSAITAGFVGTHGFAAPELYNGLDVRFSKAVDVYAFAATACFLINKSLPDELKSRPPRPIPSGYFSSTSLAIPSNLAKLLEDCLDHTPAKRPQMTVVRDEIAKHLLFNKHQALAIHRGKASHLNSSHKSARVSVASVGTLDIHYDGLCFVASNSTGEVYINNRPLATAMELPGSCVIAIGSSLRKNNERSFVTFDISNPEVVL